MTNKIHAKYPYIGDSSENNKILCGNTRVKLQLDLNHTWNDTCGFMSLGIFQRCPIPFFVRTSRATETNLSKKITFSIHFTNHISERKERVNLRSYYG